MIESVDPEKIYFSFHGLPSVTSSRATCPATHCLQIADCCASIGSANRYCYRAQCYATARAARRAARRSPRKKACRLLPVAARPRSLDPALHRRDHDRARTRRREARRDPQPRVRRRLPGNARGTGDPRTPTTGRPTAAERLDARALRQQRRRVGSTRCSTSCAVNSTVDGALARPSASGERGREPRPRIVIVGAGISGLTAAYRLQARACDVTVLEVERPRRRPDSVPKSAVGYAARMGPGQPGRTQTRRENGCAANWVWAIEFLPLRSGGSRMQVVFGGRLHQVPDGFLMIAPTRLAPLLTSPVLSLGRTATRRRSSDSCLPVARPRDESVQQLRDTTMGAVNSTSAYRRAGVGRPVRRRCHPAVRPGLHLADARASNSEYGSVAAGLSQMKMLAAHGEVATGPRAGRLCTRWRDAGAGR